MSTKLTLPEASQEGVFEGKMRFTTGPIELERAMKEQDNVNVIDVRAAADFEKAPHPRRDEFAAGSLEHGGGIKKGKT